jgi:hypothetical protein
LSLPTELKDTCLMPSIVYRISELLCHIVGDVPIGTNLGLFQLLWMLLSGRLLSSRGAVLPALSDTGLEPQAVRRAWAALAYGRWKSQPLLCLWQQRVQQEGCWQAHQHGGFRPLACDLVGFFRPRLRNCSTRHYSSAAGKALPAIVLGVLVRIGSVGGQRLPVPAAFVRAQTQDQNEADLQRRLLRKVAEVLTQEEALVCDRGFPLGQIQGAGVKRYVARGPKNFTARRATLPAYKGRGRPPSKGALVRPLPRVRNGKTIAATPADRTQSWRVGELELRAEFWDNLVLWEAGQNAPTFTCVVIHDPRYQEPLLLNTPLGLNGAQLLAFYQDRWPVEQLPLAAKQMLGAARQFVFAEECRQRLPELCLLAGAVLSYMAATQEAIAAGFWDRSPQPTSGRLRRVLARTHFWEFGSLPERVRKKESVTEHLPKGILGHRRQRASTSITVLAQAA